MRFEAFEECPAPCTTPLFVQRCVWVVPRVFPAPREDWAAIFENRGYFVFYAVNTALKHGDARRVGHSIDAMRLLPGLRRNATKTDSNGHVTSWLITDGVIRVPKYDADLTEEERNLPISDMWNHRYLIAKIAEGWMPEDGDKSFANGGI